MMDDTAQLDRAAETDPMADAAEAFKVSLGQVPEQPRDERGRFAAAEEEAAEEQEIEAEDEEQAEAPETDAEDEAESEAENDDGENDGEEAAEEAQPEPAEMPSSWAKEDADIWSSLSPEAQAKIAEREGQRDTAVNQKFQEAANLRRANEAIIEEAAQSRDRFSALADMVLSSFRPQEPSLSLLDANSGDYNPDQYHLQKAQYDQQNQWLQNLESFQQEAAQARGLEEQTLGNARFQEINTATRDALLKDVPELGQPDKAQPIFNELIEYAVNHGAPVDMFRSPTTALEWHMIWKAQQYDRQEAARAEVGKTPPPKPKKAQPAVRPGVTTPRSAARHTKVKKDFDRLAAEGSIEAGAAVWKHFMPKE